MLFKNKKYKKKVRNLTNSETNQNRNLKKSNSYSGAYYVEHRCIAILRFRMISL
jgi:hypothetical protein